MPRSWAPNELVDLGAIKLAILNWLGNGYYRLHNVELGRIEVTAEIWRQQEHIISDLATQKEEERVRKLVLQEKFGLPKVVEEESLERKLITFSPVPVSSVVMPPTTTSVSVASLLWGPSVLLDTASLLQVAPHPPPPASVGLVMQSPLKPTVVLHYLPSPITAPSPARLDVTNKQDTLWITANDVTFTADEQRWIDPNVAHSATGLDAGDISDDKTEVGLDASEEQERMDIAGALPDTPTAASWPLSRGSGDGPMPRMINYPWDV